MAVELFIIKLIAVVVMLFFFFYYYNFVVAEVTFMEREKDPILGNAEMMMEDIFSICPPFFLLTTTELSFC